MQSYSFTSKICYSCKIEKSSTEYTILKTQFPSYCRECKRKQSKERWAKSSKEQKNRARINRWKWYGIFNQDGTKFTPLEYDRLYQVQQGRCAICKQHSTELNRLLCVDHDHKTKRIRGLLCMNCNTGLGCFKDDLTRINNIMLYLEGK